MSGFVITAIQHGIQAFTLHWQQVNAALPADKPLKLTGGFTFANLEIEVEALSTELQTVLELENQLQGALPTRDTAKEAVLVGFDLFRKGIKGRLADTAYSKMVPKLPARRSSEAVTQKAIADAAHVWEQIDTDTTLPNDERPFVVGASYGRTAFTADRATLDAAYLSVNTLQATLSTTRKSRDIRLVAIRLRLKQYRAAAVSRLPSGHPLTQNLPTLF